MALTIARTSEGRAFSVSSRLIVLAAGAIDNASILLNSTVDVPAGLGNQNDNVGRYFMEHPTVLIGQGSHLRMSALKLYARQAHQGGVFHGRLKLSEATLRRHGLLNGSFALMPSSLLTTSQVHAARSARFAVNALKNGRDWRVAAHHMKQASRHAPALALLRLRPLWDDGVGSPDDHPSEGGGHAGENVARSFEIIYQSEQAPNRANRVSLSEKRDSFGYRVAHLHWRWSEIDLMSIRRARSIIVSALQQCGISEAISEVRDKIPRGQRAPRAPGSTHHLLGTTRMHDDPRHGVVDRTCQVHGTTSIHVAGPSVFTTSGYANPTLTVVALSIRLADELKRKLSVAS
jgi:choline dehydrogenase-like flavoprotein